MNKIKKDCSKITSYIWAIDNIQQIADAVQKGL